MSMTKKQLKQLQGILNDIERAYNYIDQSEVMGIAHEVKEGRELGSDYTVINPACIETCAHTVKFIRVMNKNAGSDIAGLSQGLSHLRDFIEKNQ